MYKLAVLVVLLLVCHYRTEEVSNVAEEEEQQVENAENYAFLMKLIDEYDPAGKGAIPKKDYADFLFKVITQGSQRQNTPLTDLTTLKSAMVQFTSAKEGEEIGIQSFFEDLTNSIFVFLQKKPEYRQLMEQLYSVTDEQLTPPNLEDYEQVYSSDKPQQSIEL